MLKRIVFYLAGILIFTLGITLSIKSEWGVGPWDAVFVAANNKMPLTVGIWSIIIQVFLILLAAIVGKNRPSYEASITIIIRGLMLDFWLIIVFPFTFQMNEFIAIIIWTAGLLLLGIGVGMYILADLPKTPIDGIMIAIQKRYGWTLQKARFLVEMSAAVIALLLSGPVGVGTFITAFTLATIIQKSNSGFRIVYDKL